MEMATSNTAPAIQIRCPECNRIHNDKNFARCVECGARL